MIRLPSRAGPDRGELLLLGQARDALLELVVGAGEPVGLALVARGAVGAGQLVQPGEAGRRRRGRSGARRCRSTRRRRSRGSAGAARRARLTSSVTVVGEAQRLHPLAGHPRADHLVVVERDAPVVLEPPGARLADVVHERGEAQHEVRAGDGLVRGLELDGLLEHDAACARRRPCGGGARRPRARAPAARAARAGRARSRTSRARPARGSSPSTSFTSSSRTRSADTIARRPHIAVIASTTSGATVKPQRRGEPRRAHHPQRVVAERLLRRAGRAQHPGARGRRGRRAGRRAPATGSRTAIALTVKSRRTRSSASDVAVADLGLARLAVVGLGAVRRDLELVLALAHPDGAERDADVPDRVGPARRRSRAPARAGRRWSGRGRRRAGRAGRRAPARRPGRARARRRRSARRARARTPARSRRSSTARCTRAARSSEWSVATGGTSRQPRRRGPRLSSDRMSGSPRPAPPAGGRPVRRPAPPRLARVDETSAGGLVARPQLGRRRARRSSPGTTAAGAWSGRCPRATSSRARPRSRPPSARSRRRPASAAACSAHARHHRLLVRGRAAPRAQDGAPLPARGRGRRALRRRRRGRRGRLGAARRRARPPRVRRRAPPGRAGARGARRARRHPGHRRMTPRPHLDPPTAPAARRRRGRRAARRAGGRPGGTRRARAGRRARPGRRRAAGRHRDPHQPRAGGARARRRPSRSAASSPTRTDAVVARRRRCGCACRRHRCATAAEIAPILAGTAGRTGVAIERTRTDVTASLQPGAAASFSITVPLSALPLSEDTNEVIVLGVESIGDARRPGRAGADRLHPHVPALVPGAGRR